MRTFIELCLNRDKYFNNSYLKELTGLDDYMENLLGSSFDLSSITKGKPKSECQREGFQAGIVDNIKPGTYSTMWHIFALTTSWVFLFKHFTRMYRALLSIGIM